MGIVTLMRSQVRGDWMELYKIMNGLEKVD